MSKRRLKSSEIEAAFDFDSPGDPTAEIAATVGPPTQDPRTVCALFAGIGGIELGLERAGHRTDSLCEIDEGGRAVLKKHFPGTRLNRDVCKLRSVGRGVDLVTAGFPCQDLSQAGMTKGISGEKSGLIGEVFRLLDRKTRASKPRSVLVENVPFMLQLSRGRAMDLIVTEFERLGYKWAYRIVNTMSFGLPQRRRRVYFYASLDEDPRRVLFADEQFPEKEPRAADFDGDQWMGFFWTEGLRGLGAAADAVPTIKGGSTIGIPSAPALAIPGEERIVTPDIRDAERLQGFQTDWTLPAVGNGRRAGCRWKLVGNAVTVRAAEWIGHRLRNPGEYEPSRALPLIGPKWPSAAWNIGGGRFQENISEFPVAIDRPKIRDFLLYPPKDLSIRATEGFLSRLRRGSLARPDWFEDALETHVRNLKQA